MTEIEKSRVVKISKQCASFFFVFNGGKEAIFHSSLYFLIMTLFLEGGSTIKVVCHGTKQEANDLFNLFFESSGTKATRVS